MVRHELKTDRFVFDRTWNEKKNYEIRFNDRNFKVGDALLLRETRYSGAEMSKGIVPLEYTGREILVYCRSILHGEIYGLKRGWVIMSTVVREYRFTSDYIRGQREGTCY